MKTVFFAAAALIGCAAVACDKPAPEVKADASAPVSAAASKPVAPAAPPRTPDLLVDEQGPYLSGEHADLSKPGGAQKLTELIAKLPAGAPVTVNAFRNAKTIDVEKTVDALAQAKSGVITIKTQDRDKKDSSLVVIADRLAPKLADCTLVIGIVKDHSSASWTVKGGMATKYAKGMAGPDLSTTLEAVRKSSGKCDSPYFVVGSVDSVEWGLTYDVAALIANASPPLTATKAILAREEPVAGRAVHVGE